MVAGETQEAADRAVARAIDHGVNYFDFAPSYGDCQDRLGPALRGRRDKVVLACKTHIRTADGAREQLHESLKKLETDHFDIYQLHGVPNIEELETALGPGGAIEVLLEAREKGFARNLGITCHTRDVALEALRRFDFDTILFPINFIYWLNGGVGAEVLEAAASKSMGLVAMKSMALGHWPEGCERRWGKAWYQPNDNPELAELAFRFTLSQDIHVAIPPGHLELWEMALEAAENYKPLDDGEMERLREVAAGYAPLWGKVGV